MKRYHKIIIHLLFWFYMLNQFLYPFYVNSKSFEEPNYLTGTFISLGFNIMVFYSFYFSLPLLMKPRYKIISIFAGTIMILTLAWVKNSVEIIIWRDLIKSIDLQKDSSNQMFYNSIRLSFITCIYALLIKFVIDWFDAQKLKADLVTQNKASELALLRSQINPHFLFNTLNNIYSLVYQKSENAPEAVMKLSSIMRYMLYDATTDKVPLEKEIEYLQSFIELQKLRMKEKEFVELTINGSPSGKTVAPMLLIPFVENAFKHGSKSGNPPGIITHLDISAERIFFEVRNAVKPNSTIQKDAAPGIGLHNIQRRLDLLYPDKHSLVITEDKDYYIVKLTIDNS